MAFFSKNLPPCFDMLSMMELAEPLLSQESSPYVVVALQECQRMNVLLTEVRRSLVELDKGKHSRSFLPLLIPFLLLSIHHGESPPILDLYLSHFFILGYGLST
jgi:hypothetical protein